MAANKGGIFWRQFIWNFSSDDYDFVTLRLTEYTRDVVVVVVVGSGLGGGEIFRTRPDRP